MSERVTEIEPSEQIHHIESKTIENVQRELGQDVCTEPSENRQAIAAAGSSGINEHLEAYDGNVANYSLTKELDLPKKDGSMSCQTEKNSCPQQVKSELKHEHGAGNQCTEPSGQKHHVDSNLLQNEAGETNCKVFTFVVTEQCETITENRSLICDGKLAAPSEGVIRNCKTDKSACPQQSTLGQTKDHDYGSVLGETPKTEDHPGSRLVQNVPIETSNAASDFIATERLEPALGDISKSPFSKQPEQPEDVKEKSSLEQVETSSKSLRKNSSQLGRRDKRTSKSRKKKYMLRSSIGNDRVLRSRTQEKPKSLESSNNLGGASNGVEKKRKERKKKREKRVIADEFLRMRKRLRYFLNRIQYEQNLIDAYSSEGWKGNSLEKLKPEKELQRATSEIVRRKLKIRDLFQQLDALCAEGRFPKSVFDSEGQIDSEDNTWYFAYVGQIFCAKCGSKDLSADNDIILCDGACDRGFHQFCLEPPLLSGDIPPDDEGWLCPGCDCKVDCVDLLNDSHGTKLSISDSWEKVFPEAAAAAREGQNQDHNPEFPSDDSDDDDYDPDGPGTDEKVEGNESSSDESDYASACDELEAPRNDERSLGLSSDDSEDNDYDPRALDIDENVEEESLSSDFTSDSEDLAATLDDNKFSENDEVHMSSPLDAITPLRKSDKQSFRRGENKSSLKGELLDILDSGPGQDSSPPAYGKRHVERLDYKRLHDETYGNVPSDSSDDEDWNGTAATRKRKKTTGQVAPELPNGTASTDKNEATTEAINHNLENNEPISRRRTRQKSVAKDTNNSPSKCLEGSPKSGSTGSRVKSSYRRLGEAVTQNLFVQSLYKSFKENQYPDRARKQSLAEELGLTSQQVSKWFENMRWSSRHSSCKEAGMSESVSNGSVPSPQTNKKQLESEKPMNIRNSTCNGSQNEQVPGIADALPESCSKNLGDGKTKVLTNESNGQNSAAHSSGRKRGRPRLQRPETPALVNACETGGSKKRGRQKSAP
ncbi:Octamer-binding transcription factor [Trema orientale]|uniref:Octamer-binding transcription factor n=1 Tax=Trema orientale TaxID=63057 RepID=A0A2P5EYJ9_TREOI|nr:Octamer-binding transcription factor [Trema orientale]